MALRADLATCSYPEFKSEMGLPVRISLGYPRYKLNYELESKAKLWALTPRRDYLSAPIDVYNERFTAQLERHGVDGINADVEEVKEMFGAERLVLLCFERLGRHPKTGKLPKSTEGCHRRDFARWYFDKTGDIIPELGSLPEVVEEPDRLL